MRGGGGDSGGDGGPGACTNFPSRMHLATTLCDDIP